MTTNPALVAYNNAHADAKALAAELTRLLEGMNASQFSNVHFGHVGSMNAIVGDLKDMVALAKTI